MRRDPDAVEVAAALRSSIGLLLRRFRQTPLSGELTLPESSALSRLDQAGGATASELARLEQISPQSMGATLSGLEARGLVVRRPHPEDGRRVVVSMTRAGARVLRDKRSARVTQLADALADNFTADELRQLRAAAPLLERLAQSI